jgi:hypothetical protein
MQFLGLRYNININEVIKILGCIYTGQYCCKNTNKSGITFISKSETIAAFVLAKLAAKTHSLLDYVATKYG